MQQRQWSPLQVDKWQFHDQIDPRLNIYKLAVKQTTRVAVQLIVYFDFGIIKSDTETAPPYNTCITNAAGAVAGGNGTVNDARGIG